MALRPLAADRLVAILWEEPDGKVWRAAMSILARDASPGARRLFVAAMSRREAGLRRAACDYFGAFPDPANTDLLLGALEDEDPLGAGGRDDGEEQHHQGQGAQHGDHLHNVGCQFCPGRLTAFPDRAFPCWKAAHQA